MKNANNNMLKKLVIFLIVWLLFTAKVNALGNNFFIHLLFDDTKKTITLDTSLANSIEIKPGITFSEFSNYQTTGSYKIVLYDLYNNELLQMFFDKQDHPFVINFPYVSLATKFTIFEKSSEKPLLTSNLSKFSTCNGNGICEFDKGENYDTCLGDCGTSQPKYNDYTLEILKKNNGVISDSSTGELLLRDKKFTNTSPSQNNQSENLNTQMFIIAGILIFVGSLAALGYLLFRKLKK